MAMIKIENLTFSYPSSYDPIFEDVNIQIDTDWKLGFVGRNGRGKTTLLNLLLGKYEYRGKITSSVQFDYFPYPIEDKTLITEEILWNVCPDAQEWQMIRELSYLDVESEVLWRPFDTLSNGEQTKVLLAALFLNEGHFLLIDEPTNHLDRKAREIVASYLKRKKGFILVSHDRYFLDECVDHILSLNRSDIQVQSGNFSSWMLNFERQQEFELARNKQLKYEIERLQQGIRRTSNWSDQIESSKIGNKVADRGFVGHKSAKMMKRAKVIEARQQKAIQEKTGLLKNLETAEELQIRSFPYHKDVLVTCQELQIQYDEKTVCQPLSFTVQKGESVALDGKNGSGKSSLLKLIVGEPITYRGTIRTGSGLVISYVPQDTSFLKGDLTDFIKEYQLDETLFKAMLRKLDFDRIQFEKCMEEFSEGQKKKVMLAKSLCEKAHLYVWDEPLNFIDIYSRMQIENLICEFCPIMIFVEHDHMFRDRAATQVISL